MLPAAYIPVGVSTQDCLSWSPDGELAIAAGQDIYLLIPRRDGPEPWKHVHFRVDTFTIDEWPWPARASFKHMSIGEEQARATVTALAWSPSGLAKHKRSVLAVLTSNLLLSLWAPLGNITDSGSWERVLIVNWTFAPPPISTFHDERRPLQRIRSMAWVPTCPHYADRLTPFSTRKWGTHLLAVTDDDNGIYILAVSSATVHVSMQWDAEKLLRKEVQVASNANTRPSLLSLALNARHFIDHVEFGAWTSVGDIPVMYHSSRMVHHATLEVSLGPPLQARLTDEAIKGPLVGTTKDQLSRVTLLQAQVDSLKEKYNAENALGGHVVTKTWGIASFNGLVATCISLHPTNSIEFLMSSEGSAVILFEDRKDTGDDHDPDKFPWQLSPKVDEPKTYKTILDCILDGPLLRSLDLSAFDFKIIYAAICAAVLADDAQRQQRLQTAEGLLYLLQFNTKAKLEAELEMVASCRSSQQAPHQERVQLVRKTTEARGQQTARSNPEKFSLLVHCPYCSVDNLQAIGFESMTEAYCPQRHPFTRCALTLLPILEPGSSKRCTDCGREYLNEQLHPEITPDFERLTPESRSSLAALLFDKFDTCLYCGGKFDD